MSEINDMDELRRKTREVLKNTYKTIEANRPVLSNLDENANYPATELIHKSSMAVAAVMLKVDGEVLLNEYDEYVSICNKVNVRPLQIHIIENLNEDEVMDLFREAMIEIKRVAGFNKLYFENISSYVGILINHMWMIDEILDPEENRLQDRVDTIIKSVFELED